jgi:hypothetical protein
MCEEQASSLECRPWNTSPLLTHALSHQFLHGETTEAKGQEPCLEACIGIQVARPQIMQNKSKAFV